MRTNLLFIILFLFLSYTTPSLSKRYCHPEDKKVLLQIKKEFNNPTLLSSWKSNTDCCQDRWHGIHCNHKTSRVDSLDLSYDHNLSSLFPPSIGNLLYLVNLSLFHLPKLTGQIPQSISKLSSLQVLSIGVTDMSGPIPNFLSQLKNLITLSLSFNNFYGTLPPYLHLLPNLTGIFLGGNKFTGPIPYSYGYLNDEYPNFPNLELSYNQLSGKLPLSMGRVNFSHLSLSDNKFEGDASMLFGANKMTEAIDISWNSFAFDLGKVELPKTLSILDVSHNHIYGNLSGGIENVSRLNVSYNRLCGEIPKSSYNNDVYTYIHNKCLCGSPLLSCK